MEAFDVPCVIRYRDLISISLSFLSLKYKPFHSALFDFSSMRATAFTILSTGSKKHFYFYSMLPPNIELFSLVPYQYLSSNTKTVSVQSFRLMSSSALPSKTVILSTFTNSLRV